VLLLGSEVPVHLQINKEALFKTALNNKSQVFEVYNPARGYLLFEGFDCRGEINVFGSEDLTKLSTRQAELRFDHAKVWGHYIAIVKVDAGLYFLAADNRKVASGEEALSVLRYSQYKQGKQPYDWFDADAGESLKSRVDNL